IPSARPIPAPDPALLEQGRFGPLPRVGNDGRTSIRAYAGQFERQDTRPRVSIVVADVGISNAQTEDAIRRLPPAVTLAISPYAPRAAQVAERLRAKGVETLIGLPLEPAGYPLNDPGNRALLTGRSAAENMANLEWVLSRFSGYVGAIGVVGGMRGERFAAMEQSFLALQESLRNRGLLFVDARPGAAPPARAWGRSVDVVLDEPATRAEIERRLGELEAIAKARGSALGLAHAATPVLVDRLVAWASGLDGRGMVLAPVTAIIRRPPEGGEGRPQ
ncbi:MAG: divergent polysaccharide deacetylase family protein, partial [Alphaproteobacteria bacterium]